MRRDAIGSEWTRISPGSLEDNDEDVRERDRVHRGRFLVEEA